MLGIDPGLLTSAAQAVGTWATANSVALISLGFGSAVFIGFTWFGIYAHRRAQQGFISAERKVKGA